MKKMNSALQILLFIPTPFVFLYLTESRDFLNVAGILSVLWAKGLASFVALVIAVIGIIPLKKISYGSILGRNRIISLKQKTTMTLCLCMPVLCWVEYVIFTNRLDIETGLYQCAIFVALELPVAFLALREFIAKKSKTLSKPRRKYHSSGGYNNPGGRGP